MALVENAQEAVLIRHQFEQLTHSHLYSIEEASELIQKLSALLTTEVLPQDNEEQYAVFLNENLNWLQRAIQTLSEEKEMVAATLLTIQQGKRAKKSYGQNN